MKIDQYIKCDLCNLLHKDKKVFIKHFTINHTLYLYHCVNCDTEFMIYDDYNCHSMDDPLCKKINKDKIVWKCLKCLRYKYKTEKGLINHMIDKHCTDGVKVCDTCKNEFTKVKCLVCDIIFENYDRFTTHFKESHTKIIEGKTCYEDKYKCNGCNKRYEYKTFDGYTGHMDDVHMENIYDCIYCNWEDSKYNIMKKILDKIV